MQKTAVNASARAIKYIENPTEEVQDIALSFGRSENIIHFNKISESIAEKYKSEIIKWLLEEFVSNMSHLKVIKMLKRSNINWPELDIILNSYNTE